MTGVDAVRASLQSTGHLVSWFLSDLSDADLLVRPADGANHIAWQMGHLIQSEAGIVREQLPDAVYPELPAGFAAQHGKDTQMTNPPPGFASKASYIELFDRVRQATVAALGRLSDADLDRPSIGRMAPFAPRLGDMFLLVANHSLMHAGQFSVVRRKLGRPVLF
ncbi:MAG: DinB family protein [Gemmataceae bacterium]